MRLLLTTDTVGGVWTFTRELATGLLDRGHSVALASFGRMPSPAQELWIAHTQQAYGSAFLYQPSALPLEWMEQNHSACSGAESMLLHLIDRFRADLLHSSQFCFGALSAGVPKLITAHSDVLSWAAACRPAGLQPSDWLRRYQSLVSAGLHGADAVVAPTRWMLQALTANFHFPAVTEVIPNGRTLPAPAHLPARQLQAVTVGRLWDEGKGLGLLNGIDLSMPLLVVGENVFEAAHAPTLANAQLLGSMEESSLLQTFRSSSLYLATSLYEPFGLAPLEAALCGCGLLVRDIPSLHEVWGAAAEYFTDAESLTALIASLAAAPQQLQALQQRSRERALQLSADRMVTAYLARYRQLLSAAPAEAESEMAAHAV